MLPLRRYQVITIKHSGSLVTLSADGFAAKNSVNNAFTAAGALLLLTHYQRLCGDQGEAEQKVQRLLAALREQHLVVSFEMVTGRGPPQTLQQQRGCDVCSGAVGAGCGATASAAVYGGLQRHEVCARA
jgi:hypothetical protein